MKKVLKPFKFGTMKTVADYTLSLHDALPNRKSVV